MIQHKKRKGIKTRNLIHGILSLLLSLLIIWIVAFFFCNSPILYETDTALLKQIYKPGLVYKHRSEGFAETHVGKHGISGHEDITLEKGEKIIVWGDSYVEAFQVDDKEKMPQVITSILRKNKMNNLVCYGVGMSGDSVADYYFDIPKYERLTEGVIAHIIILTKIRDTLPDQPTDDRRGLFKSEPFRLYQDDWSPPFQKSSRFLQRYGIYFVWGPVKAALESLKNLRFGPGVFEEQKKKIEPPMVKTSKDTILESWKFLFGKLQEQTDLPLIFVYCPSVPQIENGGIAFSDKNRNLLNLFSEAAKPHGIIVLDMTSSFADFHNTTGLFPRGFSNSIPGDGHFNARGHEIVSKAIADYIITIVNKNAVYTN